MLQLSKWNSLGAQKDSKVTGKRLRTTTARATSVLLLGDGISKNKSLLNTLKEKYSVIVSERNGSFRETFTKETIDLIIFELNDPISEPLSVLRTIKQKQPSLKIIVVHNGNSVKVVAKAFQYGATDFFRTPVNISLLNERIDALIHTI